MALLKRKRVGFDDPMSVVTRFVNACNRHDADSVAACLHPDFDSIQPMYPARNFRGADQVRRNWQAIFDAEPGFRLTVLRSAAVDDTVWLELHGAGRDAEVAGVFVMGVQGDRLRWARIYSALVEPVPAGDAAGASAPVQEVAVHETAATGNGEVVEEALIAPVVDMERTGRRRRRGSRRRSEEAVPAPVADSGAAEPTAEPEPTVVGEPEPEPEPEVVEPEPEPEVVAEQAAVPEPEPERDTESEPEPDVVVVAAEVVVEPTHEPDVQVEPVPVPDAAAEPVAEAGREPAPTQSEHPRRRFGKKGR